MSASLRVPTQNGTAQWPTVWQLWPLLLSPQCPFMDERIMCLHSKIKSQALEFPDQ